MIDLNYALDQEQSIFERFSNCKALDSEFKAFWSPDSNLVPHWNLVYPRNVGIALTPTARAKALTLYSNLNLTGNYITTDSENASIASEISEYFVFEERKENSAIPQNLEEFSDIPNSSLTDFVEIVSEAFNFDKATQFFFESKMKLLNSTVPSKFWIINYGNEPCGAASTFETKSGHPFMFNVAIREKYRGKKIGSSMLDYIIHCGKKPLFIYSHNEMMRKSTLPSIGGRSLGTTYLVPIERLKE